MFFYFGELIHCQKKQMQNWDYSNNLNPDWNLRFSLIKSCLFYVLIFLNNSMTRGMKTPEMKKKILMFSHLKYTGSSLMGELCLGTYTHCYCSFNILLTVSVHTHRSLSYPEWLCGCWDVSLPAPEVSVGQKHIMSLSIPKCVPRGNNGALGVV